MTIVADHPTEVDAHSVIVGVDTHTDTHTAAVIDSLGRHLGEASFETTPAGHTALIRWANKYGTVTVAGVEGTGSYGAGLTRTLTTAGIAVIEVDRPDRKARRRHGKSDSIDAYAAATAAASGRATGTPKTRDGDVESIRVLRVARTGAVRSRARAITQLKSLIVTAPEPLRSQLRNLTTTSLVATCARLRPTRHTAESLPTSSRRAPRPGRLVDPTAATKRALASLATQIHSLTLEIDDLDEDLDQLVTRTAPTLLALKGIGIEVAGQLLNTAGDNPERLRSEASFATLCGVAPIPASSGKTNRHRLSRGGDRAANAALYRIALCRLRWDPKTRAYAARRTTEGKTKPEIIRCLKRYIAREVYNALITDSRPQPLDNP